MKVFFFFLRKGKERQDKSFLIVTPVRVEGFLWAETGCASPETEGTESTEEKGKKQYQYILFQNGCHFSILLFDCKLALLASFKVKYSFELLCLKVRPNEPIDLFSSYVLFSHFRPRDVLKGIFLLFLHNLCAHAHVHKKTFERNCSLE